MKNSMQTGIGFLFFMSMILGMYSAVMAQPPEGYTWKLAWSDEFNGTTLDRSKWRERNGPRRDGIFTKEAVSLDGQGNLVLRTWKDKGVIKAGAVTTCTRFHHRYGYYETRCELPKHQGHWASFWLQVIKHNLPPYEPSVVGSEIDIFEYPDVGTDKICHNIHWSCGGDYYEHMGHEAEFPGLEKGGYHLFGLLWTLEECVFYVDGQATWRTRRGVSNHDLFLIFSDEIMDDWWRKQKNIPADFNYPEDFFKIDYVRVYDMEDEFAPPVDKRGNYLQMIEVITTPENARRLRERTMENLSKVIHSPDTQFRRFPLIDLKGNGEISAVKFLGNKPVMTSSNDLIPGESADMFCGSLEFLKYDKYDICPVLHMQMNMSRLAGWTNDSTGKKKPIMRNKMGNIIRQLLNPGTWYIFSDTVDPVIVNGKTTNKNVFILYRLFIDNDMCKKTISSSQPSSTRSTINSK